jgi:DNA-binding SARP family transcriptional activator
MMRWVRGFATLLIAAAVLLVPPAAAAAWIVRMSPSWPTAAQLRQWVQDPLTSQSLLAGVLAVAALLWTVVAGLILVDAGRRVLHAVRRLRQLPLPTPAQATATSMAGAAALAIPTAAGTSIVVPTAPPPTGAAQQSAPPEKDLRLPAASHAGASATTGDTRPGVHLPGGGWLPDQTARAAAAAGSLLWLRRRLGYQPGLIEPGQTRPAGPDPLPETVTTLQTAVAAEPAGSPSAPPVAGLAGQEPLRVDQLPTGGLGLIGPAGPDAARGLLITTLLQPPAVDRVVITRHAFAALFADAAGFDATPGLRIVDTVDSLLCWLAGEAPRSPSGGGAAVGLVVTQPPQRPDVAGRLAAAFTDHAGRVGVVLGAWPAASTWHIDTDGTATPAGRADTTHGAALRLCVLGARPGADLLTVIRHAYGRTTQPTTVPSGIHDARSTPHAAVSGSRSTTPPQRAGAPLLTLRVLGPPQLLHGQEPVAVHRDAAKQILVLLAVHPRGVTSRHLVTAIWPGPPPHTVSSRLYTTISDLRRILHTLTGNTVIRRDADRYRFDPGSVDVDLWHLQTALDAAMTAVLPAARRTALRAVIDAYPAELAADQPWPWADPPRETLRQQLIDTYTTLAALSPPAEAATLLQAGLRVDPYNPSLHRHAIKALADTGDPAGAAALADAYRTRLARAGLTSDDDILQPAPRT